MMRRWGVLCITLFAAALEAQNAPQAVHVSSPDGQVEVVVSAEASDGSRGLEYSVRFAGRPVIEESSLGLELQDGRLLGPGMQVLSSQPSSADTNWTNHFGKASNVRDHFNAALVEAAQTTGSTHLQVEMRAYDDGVAFRYIVPRQTGLDTVHIAHEHTQFTLAGDANSYPLLLANYNTPYEDEYVQRHVSNLHQDWLIGLPFLAELPGRAWLAITEADIENYPGMYLRHRGDFTSTLESDLSPMPGVTDLAAATDAPLRTPWRVILLGREPGRLIESNLVLNLNPPTAIGDTAWIQPGKTAWDWWSGDTAKGVPFTPGMNTATMKHYIDFASAAGLPYMLIDEGWAVPLYEAAAGENVHMADITRNNANVDIPELVRYAAARHVRLWLWAYWGAVDRYMDRAFPLFQKWGIAGVKIDFMQRDDEWMTGWYRRVAQQAAEHHLLVDFHGAFKPDGSERTFPNVLTREGVMGMEYSKWSSLVTPVHNTTLPFTRMLAGPMDYTPGGFLNVTREGFTPRMSEPMVMGTRAHQLALYVVFQSAFQMVADFPERYKNEPDFDFIRRVPTVWDETHVISGRPMEHVVIARRSGDAWFVGGITNWDARDVVIPLDFLGTEKYVAEIYADGADADTQPTHTARTKQTVDHASTLHLHLASGGGAAVYLHPVGSAR